MKNPAAPRPGLYVHVPFCAGGKCPYCDFYSQPASDGALDAYCAALEASFAHWAPQATGRTFGSVYFGGGTPSLLGERLGALLSDVRTRFNIAPDAEITFEANPGAVSEELLGGLRAAGFNRLSLGMQSAVPEELAALGRRHTPGDAARAVQWARAAGFRNISLDLMLAVPGQTPKSLGRSLAFVQSCDVSHVSAYLLKIEPGTAFYVRRDTLALPDEDETCALYLAACEGLERLGFGQYEISNFAKPGREARHNLVYWRDGEYLGLGPAAHSFWNGRRFHYVRSLRDFCAGKSPAGDGPGGGFEETVMLGLRLCEGLSDEALREKTGWGLDAFDVPTVERLVGAGFVERTAHTLRLTRRGFLVSNAVLAELLCAVCGPSGNFRRIPTQNT